MSDHELIQKTPGVCGGDARIAGRRICVWHLVRNRQLGLFDEGICRLYAPLLTAAELDAAWRYYNENRAEVDQAIRENEEE